MPYRREQSHGLYRIGSWMTPGGDMRLKCTTLRFIPGFGDLHKVCPFPGPFLLQETLAEAILDSARANLITVAVPRRMRGMLFFPACRPSGCIR